jgi:hypothetical protein
MIIKKSPREFLSDRKFDMITRYLFFISLKTQTNEEYFEDLYRRTILSQTKGNGELPGPYTHYDHSIKQSVDDFVREAKNLFVSMSQNGFNSEHPVPFNRNGILNGTHRVACALALDIDLWAQEYDNTTVITAYDLNWLEKTFSPKESSLIKATYLDLKAGGHYQKKISE